MKNKVLLMLILAIVATVAITVPVEAKHHCRSNNSVGIGLGAFAIGALLGNALSREEPRYVPVAPAPAPIIVAPYNPPVYYQPIVQHTRVYRQVPVQQVPVQYEQRVIQYYSY